MAEGVTVANAYVQIMPSAEGAKEAITGAVLPGMEDLGAQAGEGITGGLLTTLKGMAGPIAGVLAGLGIGKALLDIGSSFDEMRDTIVVGTGASGEALEELVGIAQDVATPCPSASGRRATTSRTSTRGSASRATTSATWPRSSARSTP